MRKFFPFLSTSTTLVSLFLGLFGITAFAYMLTGQELTMFNVHKFFELLPRPLDFVQDGMRLYNVVFGKMQLPSLNPSVGGSDIFKLLYNFARVFVNAISWFVASIMMVLYFLIIGPAYCIWYLLRILVITMQVLGVNVANFDKLTGNWDIMDRLLTLLGA